MTSPVAVVYKRFGTETISAFPYIFGAPAIYTCSPEVARQIVSTKGSFYKSEELAAITLYVSSFLLVRLHANQSLSIWGPNIFAANGDEWRRFKRIITPAFDNKAYVYANQP